MGDACLVEDVRRRTIISDLIYRLKTRSPVLSPKFLLNQLLSPLGRGQIERDARGSSGTMPKISQSHIRGWKVLLTSLEEQEQVSAHIDASIAALDRAIATARREIGLLREYRTRLVADVVTGKLDARAAAARLPDLPLVEPTTDPDVSVVDAESLDRDDGDEPDELAA